LFPNQEPYQNRKEIQVDNAYLDSVDLEELTGTPASTWRYWAHIGSGPASFKLGRRRVWKKSTVLAWLESQEKAAPA
jgi:predicted DNA-binding transcriptional regulator AlpA